jgi:DNA-binding MarR family transcriptional regulator
MAAECFCFRARRVSRLITRIYDEELRPLGIHATQLTLLNAITLLGRGEGATIARLADVLATDQTTLSRNVRPLELAGLVEVGRVADDRRVRVLRVSDAGARAVADALPLWERAHARLLGALGAAPAAELRGRFDAVAEVVRGPALARRASAGGTAARA